MLAQSIRLSDASSEQGLFKQLFGLSPDPAWLIEVNWYVECNEAAVQSLGYVSREDLLNVHAQLTRP
jgi:PAS domain-containing protein